MNLNAKVLYLICFCTFLLVFSTSIFSNTSQAVKESTCLYYFYGQCCRHCANVEPYIQKMNRKYPNIKIVSSLSKY